MINPPQAAILAVSAGSAAVVPDASAPSGAAVRTRMTVTLSADRRLVDDAAAATFLAALCRYIGNPALLSL